MHYVIKPMSVPNPRQPVEARATAKPKAEPVFSVDADTEAEARALIRERFKRLGRRVRCINHVDATDLSKLVVYVEER